MPEADVAKLVSNMDRINLRVMVNLGRGTGGALEQVLYELGRQPRARAFLIRSQVRVVMGKDSWNPNEFETYSRVIETDDEYFDYYRKRPRSGIRLDSGCRAKSRKKNP